LKYLLLFISLFLYASDLVDVYRYEGSDAVVKEAEKLITDKNYWLNRLSNQDVTWGYYESKKDILVCIKSKKKLNVLEYNKKGFKQIDTISVLTGLEGDKKKEGDLKTPVGVYRLKAIINNVDSFYGPFAFATSYPNMFDKINSKDGHGIWIHGEPLEGKRDNSNTKGCIVMDNNMLEKLKKEINYQKTYLLISENDPLKATKNEIARILAMIYKWRKAWRENDFDSYKNFYAKDFKKSDGKDLKEFLNYKKRVFKNKKNQHVEIYFSDINIIPYQNIDKHKIFRIDMYEKYISNTYKYTGPKELYVKFTDNGLKIVAEK